MEMDARAREQFGANPLGQFKPGWNIEELDRRFKREENGEIKPCRMK